MKKIEVVIIEAGFDHPERLESFQMGLYDPLQQQLYNQVAGR